MMKTNERIPEGGAIKDGSKITMEEYSEIMKEKLGKEYDRFADNVITKVNPDKNSKVLEIGPGPGWAGISLLKKRGDLQLEGIETSVDMIRVARVNAKNEGLENRTQFFESVAENMECIVDNKYDLVISRQSLHHWDEPYKVFREIKRVLKPNGKVCIYDHRRDLNLFGKLIVLVLGTLQMGKMVKYWKSSIKASYTSSEIEEILKKSDCTDWHVKSELMDLVIIKK